MRGIPAWVQLKEMLWGLMLTVCVVIFIITMLLMVAELLGVMTVQGVVNQ